eukprot:scaffold23495_cov112-Isochrysis_galbana.AAC.7
MARVRCVCRVRSAGPSAEIRQARRSRNKQDEHNAEPQPDPDMRDSHAISNNIYSAAGNVGCCSRIYAIKYAYIALCSLRG